MVIKRGIALGDGLQLIIEINDNLAKWQHKVNLYPIAANILLINQFTTLVKTERHNGSDEVGSSNDGGTDIGFLNMVNHGLVRQSGGVMYLLHLSLFGVAHIAHIGHCGDDIHIELAIQTLLDNLHVEQAEETAAEAEAQGYG